jgi:hypothetical protein
VDAKECAMGSIGSSLDNGKGSNNPQHSEAKDFRNGRVPAPGESSKNAPSLSDDGERPKLPRRVWEWSKKNLTVIALVCLLIGGIVAMIISFGGLVLRVLISARD